MAKTLTGVVTSSAADKTISVVVTSRETHPVYGKQYTVSRKYMVHDENNEANKGDKVEFIETRPVSKNKSFKLNTIIEKSHSLIELKEDVEIQPAKPSKDATSKDSKTKEKKDLEA
jgi:small subunit ribosomal protein S17